MLFSSEKGLFEVIFTELDYLDLSHIISFTKHKHIKILSPNILTNTIDIYKKKHFFYYKKWHLCYIDKS